MAKTGIQTKNKKYMLVRYGRMNALAFFEHHEMDVPRVPARVVVKTEKGLELGFLVGQLCPYKAGQFKLNSEQVEKYYIDSENDVSCKPAGKFMRYATAADINEERHLGRIAEDEVKYCQQHVEEMGLPMKIVGAEHIFGGERIIFYFMADGRVDFRELVKKIAHEYQTRIELRQIGSRDEAKLLGDIETCGQQCCCQRFLRVLKPVNMRMAKMQKATLDPSKISGYCGRLKCCLRYEDETYSELKKRLPAKNTVVKTEYGEGRVVDTQILTQLVMVEFAQGKRIAIGIEEVEVLERKPRRAETATDQEQSEKDENVENDEQKA